MGDVGRGLDGSAGASSPTPGPTSRYPADVACAITSVSPGDMAYIGLPNPIRGACGLANPFAGGPIIIGAPYMAGPGAVYAGLAKYMDCGGSGV